jgi:hypothetical protein
VWDYWIKATTGKRGYPSLRLCIIFQKEIIKGKRYEKQGNGMGEYLIIACHIPNFEPLIKQLGESRIVWWELNG